MAGCAVVAQYEVVRSTGALDPRLLRWARATRSYLVLTVTLGALTAALLVGQAWLLADIVSGAVDRHQDLGQLEVPALALLAVIVARAALGWVSERSAQRASAAAKSQLRIALAEHVAAAGPVGQAGEQPGRIAALASSGIDALDAYFSRYLPQLFLAVLVPVTVIVVIGTADWVSAVIVTLTVPLIPIFMALIGASTRHRTERKLRVLHRLAGHFLDVVAGLPTLKVFGRAKAQVDTIRRITDQYRQATLATLRVAFLSSLVLELLATLSVALVAVAVGLRLLDGQLDLRTGLLVLVLVPEAYLPLRALGTHYHASTEGAKAAEQIFEVVEEPVSTGGAGARLGNRSAPTGTEWPEDGIAGDGLMLPVRPDRAPSIVVTDTTVTYPGRTQPALPVLSFRVDPGEVVALAGPSGCGKSTLLAVVLGLVRPTGGSVTVGGAGLDQVDLDAWRAQLAWVPQRPHLFATTIAENIRLGRPDATKEAVRQACTAAGLDPVLTRLPDGLGTRLGEGGAGLSAGERQRVALARAFIRDAPLLLLDEPTAGLDGATEQQILAAVRRLVAGRTVLLVAHRPALLAAADRVVQVGMPVAERAGAADRGAVGIDRAGAAAGGTGVAGVATPEGAS